MSQEGGSGGFETSKASFHFQCSLSALCLWDMDSQVQFWPPAAMITFWTLTLKQEIQLNALFDKLY